MSERKTPFRSLRQPTLFTVLIQPDSLDGGWIASIAQVDGCYSQGETPWEAIANIAEALEGVAEVKGWKS